MSYKLHCLSRWPEGDIRDLGQDIIYAGLSVELVIGTGVKCCSPWPEISNLRMSADHSSSWKVTTDRVPYFRGHPEEWAGSGAVTLFITAYRFSICIVYLGSGYILKRSESVCITRRYIVLA